MQAPSPLAIVDEMVDNVLVLGGGLAGAATAHRLGDEGIPVTLVDRNDYQQFQPLLYQVATSQLPAEDIARPHGAIFRKYPSVEVLTAEVAGVDLSDRVVRLSDGRTVTGTTWSWRPAPGRTSSACRARPSTPSRSTRSPTPNDCVATCVVCCRIGTTPSDQDDGSLDVVVVGGGPTGVETAGALAELMDALHATGRLDRPGRITLVDRGSSLLAPFSEKPPVRAQEADQGRGRRSGSAPASRPCTRPGGARRRDTIRARTVVWGGGESGAEIAQGAGPARPWRTGRRPPGPHRRRATPVCTRSATWPTSRR